MPKRIHWVTMAVLVVGGCTKAPISANPPDTSASPGSNAGISGNQESDSAAILKLEEQAKSIVRTAGCSTSECKAAPVGSRACGGPRYYLPFCTKTTDSVALYGKLAEIAKAEQAYNRKYQIVSTCIFQMPPSVEASGGSCVLK